MILSMSAQTAYFFSVVVLGFAIGLGYDVFRIFRKFVKHADFLTQLEDAVFWVAAAVLSFWFILERNAGEVRIFAIIGLLSGMVLYFFTFSRIVIAVCTAVIEFIKKVIIITVKILLTPLRLLFRLLRMPILFLRDRLRSMASAVKKLLQNLYRYVKMKVRSVKRELFIIRKKV